MGIKITEQATLAQAVADAYQAFAVAYPDAEMHSQMGRFVSAIATAADDLPDTEVVNDKRYPCKSFGDPDLNIKVFSSEEAPSNAAVIAKLESDPTLTVAKAKKMVRAEQKAARGK